MRKASLFTKEALLKLLWDKSVELGRTPCYKDISNAQYIADRFGTWNKALKEAGLKPNKVFYSDDQLVQMLKDHTKELGRPPVKREFRESQAVVWHFGSWKRGLEAAGVLVNKEKKLTKKQLQKKRLDKTINELRRYSQEKEFPTMIAWRAYARDHDLYSDQGLKSVLGKTWSGIREYIGYSQNKHTEEELLHFVYAAASELGAAFTKRQYQMWAKKNGAISMNIIQRELSSTFNDIKRQLGLIENSVLESRVKYSDQDLHHALQDCYTFYNGKFSEKQYREWREDEAKVRPNIATIRIRLGSIPVVKESLKQETYYKHNPHKPEDYRKHIFEFLKTQMIQDKYVRWASENNAMSISPISSATSNFRQALLKVLPEFIKYLKDKEGDNRS